MRIIYSVSAKRSTLACALLISFEIIRFESVWADTTMLNLDKDRPSNPVLLVFQGTMPNSICQRSLRFHVWTGVKRMF